MFDTKKFSEVMEEAANEYFCVKEGEDDVYCSTVVYSNSISDDERMRVTINLLVPLKKIKLEQ